MNNYKVYIYKEKRDGSITNTQVISVLAINKEDAEDKAINEAKKKHKMRGTIFISSVAIRTSKKPEIYEKI